MKHVFGLLATAGVALCGLCTAHAEESPHELSANMAITTDYLYRGVTQTNEDPAVQGGFDYAYDTGGPVGFYAGVWASNVEFNIDDFSGTPLTRTQTDDSSIEIDFYGGLAGELNNGVSWDVGGLYYYYPGQDEDSGGGDYDFFEIYGGLGYTFTDVMFEPSIGGKLSYSPDFFGEDGESLYLEGSLDLSLPQGFGLGFHVGYLDVDGDKTTAGFDYTHWSVGLSKEIVGFGLDLAYHDADDDCQDEFTGNDDFCEAIVFTVSRSF